MMDQLQLLCGGNILHVHSGRHNQSMKHVENKHAEDKNLNVYPGFYDVIVIWVQNIDQLKSSTQPTEGDLFVSKGTFLYF